MIHIINKIIARKWTVQSWQGESGGESRAMFFFGNLGAGDDWFAKCLACMKLDLSHKDITKRLQKFLQVVIFSQLTVLGNSFHHHMWCKDIILNFIPMSSFSIAQIQDIAQLGD